MTDHRAEPGQPLSQPDPRERPPKMYPAEAEFYLAQGPYIARLKAAQKILETVVDFSLDSKRQEFLQPEYVAQVEANVTTRKNELDHYTQTESVPLEVFIEQDNRRNAAAARANTAPPRDIDGYAPEPGIAQERIVEGRDSVGLYLDEIGRTPLLNAEQEVELSKMIEAGLYAQKLLDEGRFGRRNGGAPLSANQEELEWLAEQGVKARELFLESNLRLVFSLARKKTRMTQLPLLDIVQEGNAGLIRAVEKFDYTKGYKFSTYATWWIKQSITRGIAQQARVIRLPVHVEEEVNKLNQVIPRMHKLLERDPEPEELAEELAISVDRVLDLLEWRKDITSLDKTIDDSGDTTIGSFIAQQTIQNPEDTVLDASMRDQLDHYLDILDQRSAGIMRLRWGLADGTVHKLADIGAIYGISAERVRQLERESINRLKAHVAHEKNEQSA